MSVLPKLIWATEALDIQVCVMGSPDSVALVATTGFGSGRVRLPSLALSKDTTDSTLWKGTFTVANDRPFGQYEWQVWAVEGTSRELVEAGTFTLEAALDTVADGVETRSLNEQRLARVQKQIDQIVEEGFQQTTTSGDTTVLLSLGTLRMERYRLETIVNRERKKKGLPPLENTEPGHITFTTNTY